MPWLRVLLYCLALTLVLVGTTLFTQRVLPGLLPGKPGDAGLRQLQTGISALLTCTLTLGLTFLFRRLIDKKSIVSLGLSAWRRGRDMISGFSLACFILCSATLVLWYSGHLKWTDIIPDPSSLLLSLGSLAFLALFEEIVFRGYILSNLLEGMNQWLALGISTVLFMIFHSGNPGFDFIGSLTLLVVALLLGLHYMYTRNLWFCLFFHLGWNFLEGPLLGSPVSGMSFDSLLETERNGDINITGGSFGLEGSFLLLSAAIFGALAYYLLLKTRITAVRPSVQGQK